MNILSDLQPVEIRRRGILYLKTWVNNLDEVHFESVIISYKKGVFEMILKEGSCVIIPFENYKGMFLTNNANE